MPPLKWNEAWWERCKSVGGWLIGASVVLNDAFHARRSHPELYPIVTLLLGLPVAKKVDQWRRRSRSDGTDVTPAGGIE